jgi:hypothetical protein
MESIDPPAKKKRRQAKKWTTRIHIDNPALLYKIYNIKFKI